MKILKIFFKGYLNFRVSLCLSAFVAEEIKNATKSPNHYDSPKRK